MVGKFLRDKKPSHELKKTNSEKEISSMSSDTASASSSSSSISSHALEEVLTTPICLVRNESSGRISPSGMTAMAGSTRRFSRVLVSDEFDPHSSRPELDPFLKGRPHVRSSQLPQPSKGYVHLNFLSCPPRSSFSTASSSPNKKKPSKSSGSVSSQLPPRSPPPSPASRKAPRRGDWRNDPPPLRREGWAEPNATEFKVRGSNYLNDGVKQFSQASVLQLFAVDLICVDKVSLDALSSNPHERLQRALQREAETGLSELPEYVFVINMCIPGLSSSYHLMAYFGTNDKSVLEDTSTPFGRVAQPFFFGDDDAYRNRVFKLIPRIAEGNFVIRAAVGSKPAIIGKKMSLQYRRHESGRYMEMIIDIGSNPVASKIVKLALGCAKALQVDIMFALEAALPETLPERILGGVRIKNLDFNGQDGQRTLFSANPTT